LGIGDWGLGIGDWGLGPIPNPHTICIYSKNKIKNDFELKFLIFNIFKIFLLINHKLSLYLHHKISRE